MLSLNAKFDRDEIEEYRRFVRDEAGVQDVTFVVEPKFDGVSVEVVYEQGELVLAATRGDGETGEAITANLRTVRTLPLTIRDAADVPPRLSIRGETFIGHDGFRQMNRERVRHGEEPYANARNAAAGILRRLESQQVARFTLRVVFYDILTAEGAMFETHWAELQALARWGLPTDRHRRRCGSLNQVVEFHRRMETLRDATTRELGNVTGIGPEIARSVRAFFDRRENREVLERMRQLGVRVQPMVTEAGQGSLENRKFVFTGELARFTREQAKRAVERRGRRATSSVSGETDYLVAGEDPGSKLREAQETNVEILDEAEFEKLLEA